MSAAARAILVTLRPNQWVKNLFVVAPLVFSKHLFDGGFALRTVAITAVFCALSGAVYAFNDVRDVELDRTHPTKKLRPIAAGSLSRVTAMTVALILVVVALTGASLFNWKTAVTSAGYISVNLTYSLHLKRVAYVDVALIAAGFVLRVLAGSFALPVPPSPWLLACTALLALLLGFGKRAHELLLAQQDGRDPNRARAALGGYSVNALRFSLATLACSTCISYGFYTRDERTVSFFHTDDLIWTLPFCITGILRFLYLAVWRPTGNSPTEAILTDWPFLLNIGIWATAVLFIIYGVH